MLPSVLQMEISQSRVSQKNFSLLNDCDRWFLQTMFHSRCSITSHLMHTYFLQKANIMDCHTVLLEILNLLLIWTLDNYGFLDFSVTNFNTDPFVIYSGNVNPIICLLHLFSWIDLSIWLYLKTTYPCWSHTSKKKKNTHILFSLHSYPWNWPCFPLTVNPIWCHRPHGIYTVMVLSYRTLWPTSDNSLFS